MATALQITEAFLADILAKLQDTVTPPTADETSNLLNQYQTLTQLIRDGYQWTAEDLEDLPTILANEMQTQLDSVLATMPLLGKYNLTNASLLPDNTDLDTFSDTGFFALKNPVNSPLSTTWCLVLCVSSSSLWGTHIFFNFFDNRVFFRRFYHLGGGVRGNDIWNEISFL